MAPSNVTDGMLSGFLQVERYIEGGQSPPPLALQIPVLLGHTSQQSLTSALSLESSESCSRKGEVKEFCTKSPLDPTRFNSELNSK